MIVLLQAADSASGLVGNGLSHGLFSSYVNRFCAAFFFLGGGGGECLLALFC